MDNHSIWDVSSLKGCESAKQRGFSGARERDVNCGFVNNQDVMASQLQECM